MFCFMDVQGMEGKWNCDDVGLYNKMEENRILFV
jgi:hypothetical protein